MVVNNSRIADRFQPIARATASPVGTSEIKCGDLWSGDPNRMIGMSLDTRIDHARLITGEAPGERAIASPSHTQEPRSVGIRDGRIILSVDPETPAHREIDARGWVLCPGFIDIHSHSDFAALYAPDATSKVMAGYTTELNGNCGYGAFPLSEQVRRLRQREYERFGLTIDWHTAPEYFHRCEQNPMALNQGLLIGHGTLRGSVLGLDGDRGSRAQRRQMQQLAERAMRQGCFGLSSGLVYAPGCFADEAELVALAEVVAHHGGVYASHLRSESDQLVEALEEFLRTCRAAGCRAQVSHLKASGRRNWHKLQEVRRIIDQTKQEGLDVRADRYPYTASCTDLATILLPDEALGGGPGAIVRRLTEASTRHRLRERIVEREQLDGEGAGWLEHVVISSVGHAALSSATGRSLAQWAEEQGDVDALEAAFDLLIADEAATQAVHFSMNAEQVAQVLGWPDVMVGSDSCLRDTIGQQCTDRPHPRAFGTPGRVLGQLVRQQKVFDLPTAVHKMTGMPAEVMRLGDRGLLRDGYWADLVLFEPQSIADCATYESPAQPPEGIRWVFVNGEPVVCSNGGAKPWPTGAHPGRLLRFTG
jgi:N-acyl-D-amino-acid deacylase